MTLEIKVKKTPEITNEEWVIWVEEFRKIFHRDFELKDFLFKYTKNPTGFSFHSMLYADGFLVGAQSFIIEFFYYGEDLIKIACGCDTFIKKEYRKEFNTLYDMCEASVMPLRQFKVDAIIGNPSPMLFRYHKEVESGERLIGNLSTFVLPLSLKSINKNLYFLDIVFCPVMWVVMRVLSRSEKLIYNGAEKFKMSGFYSPYDYATIYEEKGDLKFSWLWTKEKQIQLINDNFKSKGDLLSACLLLQKKYKRKIESIVFITSRRMGLPPFIYFHNRGLFTGRLLSNRISEQDFFEISNWEFKRGFFD